jgi:hypothetical protein
MPNSPTGNESRGRLYRTGWSVGETAVGPEQALVGLIAGSNGENRGNCVTMSKMLPGTGKI